MSDYPVTTTVPDYVYERIHAIAEATAQPVEQVVRERLTAAFAEPLPTLPPDEQAELEALQHLSDDTLWTIAAEQMPAEPQARLQNLMDRNSEGALTVQENAEFAVLIERGQHLTVRKAEAAALLTRRGFKVTPKDLAARHE